MRQRAVTNENDENGRSTRVTRAKAAALTIPEDTDGSRLVKKALGTRKAVTTESNVSANAGRKRAALGDVSNVTKNGAAEVREGKKALVGKAGLVSKATQNSRIQKPTKTSPNRSALGLKDNNKRTATAAELKRPGSGSGVMGGVIKKRNTNSTGSQRSIKEEVGSENEPPLQNRAVQTKKEVTVLHEEVKVVVKESVKDEVSTNTVLEEMVPDLDAEDLEDPLMVAEYVVEIFDYLKVLGEATMPNPNYMDHQENLQWHLRGILIDWLVEVHTRFHLLPETLFLTVNIIDRFLSTRQIDLEKLQLVGVTAMFIASKYEEVLSPHVQNFKHVADDGFTEHEILSAERYILSALNYDLSYPNPMNFLRRISKADDYDIHTRTLGKYLMEISLVDHRFMKYHPSHIAAASMYLARLVLERGEWVSYPTLLDS